MGILKKILFWRRKLTMITGAGASVSFGLPCTLKYTDLIDKSLRADSTMTTNAASLYDDIVAGLKSYLTKPRTVTFEDIYQSIQDVRTIQCIPTDPNAFDEFRPRVGSTHILKAHLSSYSNQDGWLVQNAYLNNLLDVFLNSLTSVSGVTQLSEALTHLRKKFILWSFTLNYDSLISDILAGFVSGFVQGGAPRTFDPNVLLSALYSYSPIHCHLHGSLKWGFPKTSSHDPFELHEFDNLKDGVENSKSRPSGRPAQRGETLPPSPIITGLDKTELVFRQPFFTGFLALFRSLSLCNDLLISGYGFSDRHVNMGIQQCRRYRSNVSTYIVGIDANNHPSSYFSKLTPDAWHTILPGDSARSTEVPSFPGWWKVPGINGKQYSTGPIWLWLKGFDRFCESIVKYGLPR